MQTFVLVMTNGERLKIDQTQRQKLLDASGMKPYVDINVMLPDGGTVPYTIFPNAVALIASAQG
jgi:hypothetical protein